jgi:nucleotide-binding universal stress UspA family protein
MLTDPIVVGTDGSASAERAVERAGELAQALGTPIHVVSVYGSTPAGAWMAAAGGVAVGDVTTEDAQKAAEEVVTRAREQLERRGLSVRTHVCCGDPAQMLTSIADSQHAQMLVVGNRGMSGARRVLGSVPNSVSHRARCGVLIVPTG